MLHVRLLNLFLLIQFIFVHWMVNIHFLIMKSLSKIVGTVGTQATLGTLGTETVFVPVPNVPKVA